MEIDTLDSIVRGALIDAGETTLHKYPKFLRWGIEAFRDYTFDSAQQTKTVKLPMNALKQVELPCDYVDWVLMGIQCGRDIKTLFVNDELQAFQNLDNCGCPKPFERDVDFNDLPSDALLGGGYYFFNYNQYGECLGGLYGYGGGHDRHGFKVLLNNNPPVIQLDTRIHTTDIYLEYLPSLFCPNAGTPVHPYFAKSITEYIYWRRMKFSGNLSAAAEAQKDYYNELHKARYRQFAPEVIEVLRASRRYYGQAIKQ
jgi:hypothetical protein